MWQVTEAVKSPGQFVKTIMAWVMESPIACKISMRGLEKILGAKLPYPLVWDVDVQPIIEELLNTREDVDNAVRNSDSFMEALMIEIKRSPARIKLVLGNLMLRGCPLLTWEEVEPFVFSELDTEAKEEKALRNPDTFASKVLLLFPPRTAWIPLAHA